VFSVGLSSHFEDLQYSDFRNHMCSNTDLVLTISKFRSYDFTHMEQSWKKLCVCVCVCVCVLACVRVCVRARMSIGNQFSGCNFDHLETDTFVCNYLEAR
jgi:hypothetical protein